MVGGLLTNKLTTNRNSPQITPIYAVLPPGKLFILGRIQRRIDFQDRCHQPLGHLSGIIVLQLRVVFASESPRVR